LKSDEPGATLGIKFKGRQCGYFNTVGPDTGDLEVSVDGGAWEPKTDWDEYGKTYVRPHARPLAQGLDPTKWHEVKFRIAEKQPTGSKGRFQRIGYLLVDGEVVDPFKSTDPLHRLDAVWDTIKLPLKMNLATDRFQYLPHTMTKLRDGGELADRAARRQHHR